jgi:Flp pilus assembly CpaF family ATPase
VKKNTENFAIRNLTVAIKNIARVCGDEISERQPMLDARLEDDSRVAAMFPPFHFALLDWFGVTAASISRGPS